jgi:hypothetical protein
MILGNVRFRIGDYLFFWETIRERSIHWGQSYVS